MSQVLQALSHGLNRAPTRGSSPGKPPVAPGARSLSWISRGAFAGQRVPPDRTA